jgi:hypothetical protein
MTRADRILYRSLLRLFRRFEGANVPLTGVVDTELSFWGLDPPAATRALWAHPGAATLGGESLTQWF